MSRRAVKRYPRLIPMCLWIVLSLCALPLLSGAETYGAGPTLDLRQPVAFRFNDRKLVDVLERVSQLTQWSMIYDPSQVTRRVTVVTPGEIALIDALRLVLEVLALDGQLISVITPESQEVLTLDEALSQAVSADASAKKVIFSNTKPGRSRRRRRNGPPDPTVGLPLPDYLPNHLDVIVVPKADAFLPRSDD